MKIIENKQAYYKYHIEREFDAGISLLGWEVKSLREGKVNINNSYVFIKNKEAYLSGAIFQALVTKNKHEEKYNISRNRKLLLNHHEINYLSNKITKKGYTIITISIFWKKNWIKSKIGIAKSKKFYEKRDLVKKREWEIQKNILKKQKILKSSL